MINILKASAGTGKTYRLSLEYIKALLEGEDFEKIVVMTFTRKATAEIRGRIFEQLEELLNYGSESKVLANLRQIDDNLELDLKALEEIYQQMLLNKDQIKVYTIDSFINIIFKKAIAPYLDIYAYQIIDDGDNEELIEEVFKKILDNRECFNLMEEFLVQNVERDIKSYIDLLKKILKQRWKFFLIEAKEEKKQFSGDLLARLEGCIEIIKSFGTIGTERTMNFFNKKK